MPDPPPESAPGTWSVPRCPFTIEYLPRVLDDIRLNVVDAFFSLPHGGVEIGGVLLGRYRDGRLTIAGHAAMECEHASGPSFTLSANDTARLSELLAEHRGNPEMQPVGWYHSHTRSEVQLSEADLEIHRQYFPEAWQVALVVKPHAFEPMRCGFFFREADGTLHATESYQEFQLEAMPLRQMPSGEIPPLESSAAAARPAASGSGPVIDVAAESAAPVEEKAPIEEKVTMPHPAPLPQVPETAPPAELFQAVMPPPKSWGWVKVVLAFALGVAAGIALLQAWQVWAPKAAVLDLYTADTDGQLQVRWDRSSPVVAQGTAAVLTIADGGPVAREIHLDREHLQKGTFTYGRESGQVNVALMVTRPDGPPVKAVATFAGKPPARTPDGASTDAEVIKLKSDLEAQVERVQKVEKLLADQSLLVSQAGKMKSDLARANARVQQLEKNLAEAQGALKQQQRKRMGAQDPGTAK